MIEASRPKKNRLRTTSEDFKLEEGSSTQANSEHHQFPLLSSPSPHVGSDVNSPILFSNSSLSNVSPAIIEDFNETGDKQCSPGEFSLVLSRRRFNSENCLVMPEPIDFSQRSDDYQQKYKTEICKNYEFKGFCPWGIIVS